MKFFDLNYEAIRAFDANGILTHAGARWREARPAAQRVLIVVGNIAAIVAVCGMSVPYAPAMRVLVPFAIVTYVASYAKYWRRRAVVFDVRRNMMMPHGVPGAQGLVQVDGSHKVISIESAPMRRREEHGYDHTVRAVTSEGDTIWLTRHLKESEALKIAVSLQLALDAIRQSPLYEPEPAQGSKRVASRPPARTIS